MPSQNPKSLTQWLADSMTAQRIVLWCKLDRLANWLLEKIPLHRQFGNTKMQYRIRRLESGIAADEVFGIRVYRKIIRPEARTILDIGCNTGFFSLYCANELGSRDIEGIAIDANPEMARETRWHLSKNGVTKIAVIDGLAGAPKTEKTGVFYISPSNIASSVRSTPNPNLPAKGELKAIEAPAINLAEEWEKRFGDKRIDILKIDVEGSERELILNSPELLARADSIAIDIHKWAVSPEEIERLFAQNGFELFDKEGDSVHCVVDFFRRRK